MKRCSYGNEKSYIFQIQKVLQDKCFEKVQFVIEITLYCIFFFSFSSFALIIEACGSRLVFVKCKIDFT